MVPVASVVLIWQVVFDYNGTLNAVLGEWFQAQPVDWMKSSKCLMVVVLLFLWKNLGYNMILFLAALNNIPRDCLEVAELEGAGPLYRLLHIKAQVSFADYPFCNDPLADKLLQAFPRGVSADRRLSL